MLALFCLVAAATIDKLQPLSPPPTSSGKDNEESHFYNDIHGQDDHDGRNHT